jgi:hypothetical protein
MFWWTDPLNKRKLIDDNRFYTSFLYSRIYEGAREQAIVELRGETFYLIKWTRAGEDVTPVQQLTAPMEAG